MIHSANIYKKAENLIKKYKTRNLFEIAENMGLHLYFCDDFKNLLGMYKVIQRRRCIFLNNNMDENLMTMVLAHEMGHDVLHRELSKSLSFQEYELLDIKSKPEYEANVFASHLLIDDEKLLSLIHEKYDVVQIASLMEVNVNLLLIKLNELNKLGTDYNLAYIPSGDFLKKIKC